MTSNSFRTILILAANPKDSTHRRLDEEVREIDEGLTRAKQREQFHLETKWAALPRDVNLAIMESSPQIVHFSGHGVGDGGLAFSDETGHSQPVDAQAIAGLFELFADQVECVLLNACYAEEQAAAIAQHIPYVIGTSQAVGSEAARAFAVGFYDALGAGRSIEFAYKYACNSIRMAGIAGELMPVLKQRSTIPGSESPASIAPLPVNLDEPEGQVPLDSALYVTRPPIETKCYETIVKPGALIRIKAPRQMGKSSLMLRILDYASQQGYEVASLNFQLAEQEIFSDLDEFLQWFCNSITWELNREDKVGEYWQGTLGSKNKCTNYFQRYLLTGSSSPLMLCLDEVDAVFQYPTIATDFFSMLRAWHENAKIKPIWKNLRLVIVHSKEVYIPLNINQSPFNVGVPIELPPLTQAQVVDLVERHGLKWSMAEVERLMAMVAGHPYLVRVALYQIARGEISLDRLLQVAPTEGGLYGEHLRRHLLNLQGDDRLVLAIKQVVAADQPVAVATADAFKLSSMGLVRFQDNNVVPLCNLYRQYFKERLRVGT